MAVGALYTWCTELACCSQPLSVPPPNKSNPYTLSQLVVRSHSVYRHLAKQMLPSDGGLEEVCHSGRERNVS